METAEMVIATGIPNNGINLDPSSAAVNERKVIEELSILMISFGYFFSSQW